MTIKKDNLSDVQVGDPRFCDIVVATKCVLRCKMCKAWQGGLNSHEITFEESKMFVRSLAEFVKFPLEINVMGGEPLLKDWCLDLCTFIHEQGFRSIISTNAYLIDEDMAKKIADSKLSVLAISLESLKAKTHDFYRGVDGAFAKVMKALEFLDKYCRGKLTITVLTIIMEKNLDDILELTEWVNSNHLFENISFLALLETGLVQPRQDWFKRPEYAQLWPQNVKKTYKLIDELIGLRKKGYKIWNPISQLEAFKSYYTDPDKFMQETEYRVRDYIIDLDENGTIYLSGEPLGNIKADNVGQLWFSEKANQIREKIFRYGPGKRCCVINFVCAFPSDKEYRLKHDNQNSQVHQELGISYLEQSRYDKAMDEFKLALEISPDNEHAMQGIGFCHKNLKQFDKAIIAFNQVIKLNPQNEHAHHGLGLCYQHYQQFDKAIVELNEAIKINPENDNVHQGLGFYYKDVKQLDKAIIAFNQAIKLNPQNEHAHRGLGLCYLDSKQFDKAAEELLETVAINPNNEEAYEALAYCYESLRQFDKAIEKLNQALRINPNNEFCHLRLGCCYESRKDFHMAIAEFQQVLKISPRNEYASHGLASCYEGLEQHGYSIDSSKSVIETKHDNNTGLCRFKEVSRVFGRILKIGPDNKEELRHIKEITRPDFCVIEVSHKCMLRCKMCNYWQTAEAPSDVDIKGLCKFVSSLKDFVNLPFEMNISGGEPLLKEGILDLVEFIAHEGFRFSLVTNGYLISKPIATRIADSGLNFLAVSLDSLDETTHDYLRGIKGAHNKAMEAIEHFMLYRGKLQNLVIQTIIMGPNLDGILDLVHWAQQRQLSCSLMAITRPNMVPIDAAWYKKDAFSFLWPKDVNKVQSLLDSLIKLKDSGYRIDNPIGQLERFKLYFLDPERFVRETPCSLGDRIIHVNPRGDIYLCCEMEAIGNIKEGDMGKIWASERAGNIREKIMACKRNCAGMVNCYRELS